LDDLTFVDDVTLILDSAIDPTSTQWPSLFYTSLYS
jgi:hypothetical protein